MATRVWHVNTTWRGGGVAEVLDALVADHSDSHFQQDRFVTSVDLQVFRTTKRLHYRLHGVDGGELPSPAEHSALVRFAAENTRTLMERVDAGDIVVLHDPQTVAMAPALVAAGLRVVWRCHIGTSTATPIAEATWEYLSRFWAAGVTLVFSDDALVPSQASGHRVWVIAPSISASSVKNEPLAYADVRGILCAAGLGDGDGNPRDLGATLFSERPLGDGPVIVQVSRWDPLKDMPGVLRAFAGSELPRLADLVLCGPAPESIVDDPDGVAVLETVLRDRNALPKGIRQRVHVVCPRLDDEIGNARLVNALQRRATVVAQKSLQEGFGLTVTEAMWKARPVVASRVGGIAGQIVHGESGLLIDDPYDVTAFARLLIRVLTSVDNGRQLGRNAARRVAQRYLTAREATDHQRLYRSLTTDPP